MKATLLLLISCFAASSASVYAPANPERAVRAYFAALSKADATTANKLTAHFPKFGETEVAAVTERYIELQKRPRPAPVRRGSKTIEDCAVVIIFESPTDPDPVYLLKQDEVWRVLPELTQFNRADFELPEPVQGRFRKLQAWYETQVGKARVGQVPASKEEPFKDATMMDSSKLAKLLDAGLEPNTRSPDHINEPLLWRAVRLRQPQAVKLLLERGARVDERSATFKKTALFHAAYDGSMEIARLLLDGGADPNALDISNNNPLRDAILANRPAMVRLLRERGANPNQVNTDGENMKAIAEKHGTPKTQAALTGP